MIDNEKNVSFWDKVAERSRPGNGPLAGMLMEGSEFEALYRCRAEQSHLLRMFRPTKETKVLEIGSGGGRWGFWFADKVKTYVGIDLSPKMTEIAEAERIRRGLSSVRFECAHLLDFHDDTKYDLIYFSGVLQYMDDTVVQKCIEKAASMLSDQSIIVSRDTVQTKERVQKQGEYPVIYRKAMEYIAFFSAAGFNLEYSEISYPHKRFTGIASRLYKFPGVSYRLAYVVRDILCQIDNALGNPEFLKTSHHRAMASADNPQEHRFFKYVRKS
ncbi:MAG: class I SAM-dependent methyltransferase [Pirellulales bacterium]|nr:class I SAM-dependent methyltransferase [Pirellulales bacterium]